MKCLVTFLFFLNITILGQNSSSVKLKWEKNYPSVDSSINYLSSNSKNTAVDKDGSLYLLVSTISDDFPFYRFKLTKYNSSGLFLWQIQSKDIESNNYVADILEIDNSNNIYVAAHKFENNSPGGLLLLKFSADGNQLWIKKYNGSLINSFSSPFEIKFDTNENVILIGYSGRIENNSVINDSLLIIKYSKIGIEEWTAKTSRDSLNYMVHCALDDSNNIFVSGESIAFSHIIKFTKYNHNGEHIWSSSYLDKSFYYLATDLASDKNGNHIITGNSTTLNFNSKWITIMFDKNGLRKWIKYEDKDSSSDVYETPLLLNIDKDNFINVLGYENKNNISNFFLVKYDTNGNKISDKSFIDTTAEFIQRVILDNSGNLYSAGFFRNPDKIYLIKYNDHGNKVWNSNFLTGGIKDDDNGMNLILDNSGNVYLTTEDSSKKAGIHEVITSKYNNNGKEIWTIRSNEFLKHKAVAMFSDNNDNTYMTGWIENGKGVNQDFITIKYDSSGKISWINRYDGPAHSIDIPYAITGDNAGNVYVTGGSKGINSNIDYATIKYNSNGDEEWIVRYNGSNTINGPDYPVAIVTDNVGDIYVSGNSIGADLNDDFVTIKYNKFGQLQWVQRYNSLNNGKDSVVSIAIDNLGNIYVAGISDSTISLYTYLLIKYDPSGQLLWVQRYHQKGDDWERVKKIVIDKNNNIYVTGTGFRKKTNEDIMTVKYNSDGIYQWSKIWDDPSNSSDNASDIKADKYDNVYVTGYGSGGGTGNDFVTLKYNSSGNLKWAVIYDSPQNLDDFAANLALDYQENPYIAGFSLNNNNYNYSLVKYDTNGVKLWDINYIYSQISNSFPVGLSLDRKGNIVLGGFSETLDWSIFNLIKYIQPGFKPDAVAEDFNKINSYRLYQNFPNPFNPITTVKYSIPKRSFVKIKLYDLLGRELKSLVSKEEDAGSHQVKIDGASLSSGVYFYIMYTENFIESKKMILLK